MFEIRMGSIRESCEEMHNLHDRLSVKESMLSDLLADMRRNGSSLDSAEKVKREILKLDAEKTGLRVLAEGLYALENRYKRCEGNNIQEAENCSVNNLSKGMTDGAQFAGAHINFV